MGMQTLTALVLLFISSCALLPPSDDSLPQERKDSRIYFKNTDILTGRTLYTENENLVLSYHDNLLYIPLDLVNNNDEISAEVKSQYIPSKNITGQYNPNCNENRTQVPVKSSSQPSAPGRIEFKNGDILTAKVLALISGRALVKTDFGLYRIDIRFIQNLNLTENPDTSY
jgi:hypothetical protein